MRPATVCQTVSKLSLLRHRTILGSLRCSAICAALRFKREEEMRGSLKLHGAALWTQPNESPMRPGKRCARLERISSGQCKRLIGDSERDELAVLLFSVGILRKRNNDETKMSIVIVIKVNVNIDFLFTSPHPLGGKVLV